MKKKLLGILILPTLVMAGVTGEGSNQTKTFEKKIYALEDHRTSALDVMYSGETNVNETFKKSITSKGNTEVSSYSALELMHEFGTDSKEYAKVRETLKGEVVQEEASTALELMYSRLS
ncbi:hypothetical protein PM10SUCC1_34260 [Propionigenium maris DSM 9537]|uniref:Uncharacterized protein n=1 Tax=Propionigenium maris DSM 9537 TaxID=1123000 RepID=A0A9W6GQ29_9FUSO|nr:hypothetical protein [Propionigenium maris]GLI57912.1 hypothetical protein PM10SUCC1_34260 [Propionigenium maris DSM 9537]